MVCGPEARESHSAAVQEAALHAAVQSAWRNGGPRNLVLEFRLTWGAFRPTVQPLKPDAGLYSDSHRTYGSRIRRFGMSEVADESVGNRAFDARRHRNHFLRVEASTAGTHLLYLPLHAVRAVGSVRLPAMARGEGRAW